MGRRTDDELNAIFDSTSGKCHLCGRRLAWRNHGVVGGRGAWHVDHSRARARGGSDFLRNLRPACITCNCSKRDGSNRTIRARHGRTRAPLSRDRRRAAKIRNGVVGAGLGWVAGRALLGLAPAPAILLGLLGLAVGGNLDPDEAR